MRAWAQRDYGNRVGICRLMDVLASTASAPARPSTATSATIIRRSCGPQSSSAGSSSGTTRPTACWLDHLVPEEERQTIARTLRRIAEMTGRKPVGWLGAGLAETWHTLDYLVEEGCLYVADWVNDDQPYLMDVGGKRLVSIPYSYEINDSPHFQTATARSTSSKR